jgi:hypothetical protein
MDALENIQTAIARLSDRDRRQLHAWMTALVRLEDWAVREASVNYVLTPELLAVQIAIQNLNMTQIRELREWLELMGEETPQMLAAIDEGLRSLNRGSSREFSREELHARVRQWAGLSS